MESNTIQLDGSFGEGGGQILRTSLALSLLTGRPFHLRNIRAKRSKPGLQPQHLMSVRAAAKIGIAKLRGASVGSTDLTFEPGEVSAGKYRFDIGTAGATGLVLHTIYLPLMLKGKEPSEITLVGGTHVDHSPCFHFLDTTWCALLQRLGLNMTLRMVRPGFYPRGGGIVTAHLAPGRLRGVTWRERGSVSVHGFSAIAGLPDHVAERQARQAVFRLQLEDVKAEIREEKWEGGPGSVLGLVVETSPAPVLFFGLGARGKPAESVADEAANQAIAYLHAAPTAVDAHSADQMILPLALAEGSSEFTVAEVTQHLLTNVAVIRRFVERTVTVEGKEGQWGVIRVE
jgi:RNA 3'-terminal phosphate cyclase (ATP)